MHLNKLLEVEARLTVPEEFNTGKQVFEMCLDSIRIHVRNHYSSESPLLELFGFNQTYKDIVGKFNYSIAIL